MNKGQFREHKLGWGAAQIVLEAWGNTGGHLEVGSDQQEHHQQYATKVTAAICGKTAAICGCCVHALSLESTCMGV